MAQQTTLAHLACQAGGRYTTGAARHICIRSQSVWHARLQENRQSLAVLAALLYVVSPPQRQAETATAAGVERRQLKAARADSYLGFG